MYNEILGPVQNGVGAKGGILITAFRVQVSLDANPGFCVIQWDMKNGYNKVRRNKVPRDIKMWKVG